MYLAINFANDVAALSASEDGAVKAVRAESEKMGDSTMDIRTTWVRAGSPFLVSRGDMQLSERPRAPARTAKTKKRGR